jgi:putative oxidoreductase
MLATDGERDRRPGPAEAFSPFQRRRIVTEYGSGRARDGVLLLARVLLVVLFLVFGWSKLTGYAGAVAYMAQAGLPMPQAAAGAAILIEFFVALAVLIGFWTRPLAVVLAAYTLAAAFVGHRYWTMSGADRFANMINFYKNVSIVGGFLLLYVAGPGKYSVDARKGPRRRR